MPAIPRTDVIKKEERGNCFNFLSVQRYRQTPTNQIIIDSPRLNGYTAPLLAQGAHSIYKRGERFIVYYSWSAFENWRFSAQE